MTTAPATPYARAPVHALTRQPPRCWIEYTWLLDPYGDFPVSPDDYTFAAMRRVFADADAIGGT
jgi:hypothetical protein